MSNRKTRDDDDAYETSKIRNPFGNKGHENQDRLPRKRRMTCPGCGKLWIWRNGHICGRRDKDLEKEGYYEDE